MPTRTRHRRVSDPVEVLAGLALAVIAIGAFSYAFVIAWRVLG